MSYRHKVLTLWSEISVNDEETRILRTPSRDLPIPLSREAVRRIRIKLGDEMTAGVGRAKIAKNKLAEAYVHDPGKAAAGRPEEARP